MMMRYLSCTLVLAIFMLTAQLIAATSRITLPSAMSDSEVLSASLRRLAIGDFAQFNKLFADATLSLPDADVSRSGLKLRIRNLRCTDISIGDMQTNYTQTDARTLLYGLYVNPFAFRCTADYRYEFSFFIKGSGRLEAKARGNQANAQISFASPTTFAQDPPSATTVQSCNTRIEIYDMSFKGGVVARILDLLEDLVDDVIENEVEATVCDELTALENVLNDFLADSLGRIQDYLGPIPSTLGDPLFVERSLVIPPDLTLFSWLETEDTVGSWFDDALDEVDRLLGEVVDDSDKGGQDLGVNVLLRKHVLDDDGALSFRASDFGDDFNPVLFEGHDRLTESAVRLDTAKIYGLDSLKTLDPLNIIGNYTIQNEVRWDFLDVELDLIVTIKPSTKDNALLEDPSDVQITENIQVSFGINNVDMIVSFLLALDQIDLGSLELGSILRTENLYNCFLSAIHDFELSGLNVNITSVDDPVLDGFISKGIDRFISASVEAVFRMYEPTFVRAVPYLFQDMVRSLTQENVVDPILSDESAKECPSEVWPKGSVDFRDLFLDPADAVVLGGSGASPYGDLARRGYEMAMDWLTEIGEDGLPMVNERLIRSATENQSGEAGSLQLQKSLFSFARDEISNEVFSEMVDKFEFRLSDLRFNKLDTVLAPLTLLEPTKTPRTLKNKVTMGNSSDPLSASIRLLLDLEGSPPFDMFNEIDISASVDSLGLTADMEALMKSTVVSKFPLRHVLDMDCWVSTLTPDGVAAAVRGLSIESFDAVLSSLELDATCISCSSGGADILPEILDLINDNGARETLLARVPPFLVDLAESDWLQTFLDRWLDDAPKFCPFQPEYAENATRTNFRGIGLPVLAADSIDTAVYTSVLAGWVAFLVFAENQREQEIETADPLSPQRSFKAADGSELLDWSDLGNSTGLGSLADTALEQLRSFLGDLDDRGSPGINSVAKDLLDDSRSLSFDLDNASFERDGIVLSLDSVALQGLDSFSYADVLRPIGAQTLQNSVRLETLAFELGVSIGQDPATKPEEFSIRIEVDDVAADIALFAPFDVRRLRKLPLGGLLKADKVLPCLLSTMFDFQVPQLAISIGSFRTPVVEGLMADTSASMRRVLNATVERFAGDLVEAVPSLFEGVAKELIASLVGSYTSDARCPEPVTSPKETTFVDFRDLLLPKTTSLEFGGSGTLPYGDVVRLLWDFVGDNILAIDSSTGISLVNEKIIGPLTEEVSGVPGRFEFERGLLDSGTRLNAGGLDAQINLKAYDVYIENLDTIGEPLSLLEPMRNQAHHLNNTATAGIGSPVSLGGRFSIELFGGGKFLLLSYTIVETDLILTKVQPQTLPSRTTLKSISQWKSLLSC